MRAVDVFPYVWLGFVALAGILNPIWAMRDLKAGSAQMSWNGMRAERVDQPVEFWFVVWGKMLALPMAGLMFWFGLDMLKW